jgi:hypothetical protein
MPLLVALMAIVVVLLLAIALTPLSILLRYRAGTARRVARGWQVTTTMVLTLVSTGLLVAVAAVSSLWAPDALQYAIAGFVIGGGLGIIGLQLTRWEWTPTAIFYTPNRWLVLVITLVVVARVSYGFWRSWQAWQVAPESVSTVAASGAAGAFGAAAIVLGYYTAYWIGLRRHLSSDRRPPVIRSRQSSAVRRLR